MGLDRKLQYHSATGCCICGTKTSSSRFTSSARFESLFAPCFGTTYSERRSGDICNACVLIVKRFRNGPRDSCKNWAHVSWVTFVHCVSKNVAPGNGGTKTNLKVREHTFTRKKFLVVPLHFFWIQLVILATAFVMVSTVWSVLCLLFYSRCLPCPAICKSGGEHLSPMPYVVGAAVFKVASGNLVILSYLCCNFRHKV